MDNKAQATGIVWIIAIPIIVLLSVIFVFLADASSGGPIIRENVPLGDLLIDQRDPNVIELESAIQDSERYIRSNFDFFLNKKIEINGETKTIAETIENDLPADYREIVKSEAEIFFSEQFPKIDKGFSKDFTKWWFVVYDISNLPKTSKSLLGYNSGLILEQGPLDSCQDISERKYRENILLVKDTQTKRIALCVNEEYYNWMRGYNE